MNDPMLDPDYDDYYRYLPWYSRWWKHGGGWDFRNNLRRALQGFVAS